MDAFPIKNALFNSTRFYYCFDCIIFFQLTMTDFFSSDDSTVICPPLHLKEEENDCSQLERKKHTGGMWPQGRDFGYRQGSEVRGVWQINTCYWGPHTKKKIKGSLNLLLSRLKQNLMATNRSCFHKMQGPASEVWMASSSHGDQCTPHNLCILQPWGMTLRGARPHSKPSLWEGKRNKTERGSVRSRHMNQK